MGERHFDAGRLFSRCPRPKFLGTSQSIGPKPENVAIGINRGVFVLTPLGVLRHIYPSSDGEPLMSECLRIIHPQVGRVLRASRVGAQRLASDLRRHTVIAVNSRLSTSSLV